MSMPKQKPGKSVQTYATPRPFLAAVRQLEPVAGE